MKCLGTSPAWGHVYIGAGIFTCLISILRTFQGKCCYGFVLTRTLKVAKLQGKEYKGLCLFDERGFYMAQMNLTEDCCFYFSEVNHPMLFWCSFKCFKCMFLNQLNCVKTLFKLLKDVFFRIHICPALPYLFFFFCWVLQWLASIGVALPPSVPCPIYSGIVTAYTKSLLSQ